MIESTHEYFLKTYNLDIDDLNPLRDYALWCQKNRQDIKKDIKRRTIFLTETLEKWKAQTKQVVKETDVKFMNQRNGVWRFDRFYGDPNAVVKMVFNEDKICELRTEHESLLQRLSIINMVSPISWLIFNLAHLFKHTEFTAKTNLHPDHVNWEDILDLLQYWRSEIQDAKVIPHITPDAVRKRFEEAKKIIKKEYGRQGKWHIFLDPVVLNYFKNRKSLDRAGDRAYKRLSRVLSQ